MGFWKLPPRLLGRLVNERKWRKNFQNVIYTQVCSDQHMVYAHVCCTDTGSICGSSRLDGRLYS